MLDTPSRNPYVAAASKILFGDEEFAQRCPVSFLLQFLHPTEDRSVTVNELAAELEQAANG